MLAIADPEDIAVEKDKHHEQRNMGTFSVVIFLFFTICGGAYGIEVIIQTAYPLYTILGFLIVPWFVGIPEGLLTAELTTAMPENGGCISWIKRSLGSFWGFQKAILDILVGALTNAIYPIMFTDYLAKLTGPLPPLATSIVRLLVLLLMMCIALRGNDLLLHFLKTYMLIILAPFAILILVGLPSITPADFIVQPPPAHRIDWELYFSIILWSNCGYDLLASIGGKIKNPARTVPAALLLAILIINLAYLAPILIGVSHLREYARWDEGAFCEIGSMIGGPRLRYLMIFSALVAALGLLNAHLFASAWSTAMLGREEYFHIPALLRENRHGTPYVALLCNTALTWAAAAVFPFAELVEMEMILYSMIIIMEYVALIWFRVYNAEMSRPFRIPAGVAGLVALFAPHSLLCVWLAWRAPFRVKMCAVGAVVLAAVLYRNKQFIQKRLGRSSTAAVNNIFNP